MLKLEVEEVRKQTRQLSLGFRQWKRNDKLNFMAGTTKGMAKNGNASKRCRSDHGKMVSGPDAENLHLATAK